MTDEDRETLTAYLDGELDEAAEQALEARLSRDPKLRTELQTMKQTWGLLDYLPKAEASTDFTNRTMDRLTVERANRSTLTASWPAQRMATWLVCGVVALTVGVIASASYRTFVEKPTGPDEPIVRNMRLLERLPAYEAVEDIEFLKALDDPDLFGDSPETQP